MKKQNNIKEKRVINLQKPDFDKIKKYCDTHAFNMPKWITKIALEEINKNETNA